MIISEKYKYVFIQNQATASSTIGKELCMNYDGENILKKHSSYDEFLEFKGKKAKDYFIFCGIRNPLDQFVTFYYRELFKNKLPSGPNSSFLDFLNYFTYKKIIFPDYFGSKNYRKVNYVIRYENLQEDFSNVLKILNIPQKRPLQKNSDPTPGKNGYIHEYDTPQIKSMAILFFKEAMIDLGYKFPSSWNTNKDVNVYKKLTLFFINNSIFNINKISKLFSINNYVFDIDRLLGLFGLKIKKISHRTYLFIKKYIIK